LKIDLNRLFGIGRAGLAIARSTLAQWVVQTGVRLQPLVDALREAVLSQGVMDLRKVSWADAYGLPN